MTLIIKDLLGSGVRGCWRTAEQIEDGLERYVAYRGRQLAHDMTMISRT